MPRPPQARPPPGHLAATRATPPGQRVAGLTDALEDYLAFASRGEVQHRHFPPTRMQVELNGRETIRPWKFPDLRGFHVPVHAGLESSWQRVQEGWLLVFSQRIPHHRVEVVCREQVFRTVKSCGDPTSTRPGCVGGQHFPSIWADLQPEPAVFPEPVKILCK